MNPIMRVAVAVTAISMAVMLAQLFPRQELIDTGHVVAPSNDTSVEIYTSAQPDKVSPTPYNGRDDESYLEMRCAGYKASTVDVYIKIRKEMSGRAMDIYDGLLEEANRHAASAAWLIEQARLCGGQTVEDLDLSPDHLVGLGMLRYESVARREKP